SSDLILFVVPWLDRSPVRSMRYKGWYSRVALLLFVVSFIILGVLGTKIATEPRTALAQVCTVLYFAFFLLMPWYSRREQTTTPPQRVTGRYITVPQFVAVLAVIFLLTFLPLKAVGAEATVDLDPVDVDLRDKASLQAGAGHFMNYCLGCHSLDY